MEKKNMQDNTSSTGSEPKPGKPEIYFEKCLWNIRYIVILGVIFGAISAIALFIVGSLEIIDVLKEYILVSDSHMKHDDILIGIIGAIDFYLISLVLLIFSFGTYELFISELNVARMGGEYCSILDITNLDDLKNKIIKVIIMVLIVNFFQRILSMELSTAIDMLAMAVSICVICIGVYFIGRHHL
ncbi:MAG: YqhA family protein [Euryarchaeota archaeon]|nr:YqhA family protein [Euryarchaeota archaeon]